MAVYFGGLQWFRLLFVVPAEFLKSENRKQMVPDVDVDASYSL